MARGTDPLQRDQLGIVSQDTGDRLIAPVSSGALGLAHALGDIEPAAASLAQGLAQNLGDKQRANAARDVIATQGEKFADAVREGKLEPTQNPWYMDAYKREGAAVRAERSLRDLQTQAASWDTRSDPTAFAKQWNDQVSALASSDDYKDDQEARGFVAAASQVTPQVLSANVSQNVQRVQIERSQNVSSLAADAIANTARAKGGVITTGDLIASLQAAHDNWFKTGGDLPGWNAIVSSAVQTAATATSNPALLDALRGIGPDGKPTGPLSEPWGAGASPSSPPPPAVVPGPAGGEPVALPQPVAPQAPALAGLPVHGPITSPFGSPRPNGKAHNGLDIDGAMGDPVRPRAGGKVLKVGQNAASGNYVIIDHGGGVTSSYAHLSVADVKRGDTVAAGQVIGAVGNTGHVVSSSGGDGSHLHYVIRVDGKEVDPQTFNWSQHQAANPAAPAPQLAANGAPLPAPQPIASGPGVGAIPRAPSLYDVAGTAQDVEQTRYHIQSAQTEGAQQRIRTIQANRLEEGMQVADVLYTKYGSAILKGNYDVNAIVNELTAAGYRPQAIAEGLGQIRTGVGESAALMQARTTINGNDPAKARQLFALATEGRTNGYSPDYEQRVGSAVLKGDITTEQGVSFVAAAHAKTDYDVAQGRQVKAEARSDFRFDQQMHYQTQPVHNFGEMKAQADLFAEYALRTAKTFGPNVGYRYEDGTRQYLRVQLRGVADSWLALHPADWDGAVKATNEWTEQWMRRQHAAITSGAGLRRRSGAGSVAGNPRR